MSCCICVTCNLNMEGKRQCPPLDIQAFVFVPTTYQGDALHRGKFSMSHPQKGRRMSAGKACVSQYGCMYVCLFLRFWTNRLRALIMTRAEHTYRGKYVTRTH